MSLSLDRSEFLAQRRKKTSEEVDMIALKRDTDHQSQK